MQAIATKYFGPVPVKGARVKATAQSGSIILDWDHALNFEQNHVAAAKAYAVKMGWSGTWHCGGLPDGRMAFVIQDDICGPAFSRVNDEDADQ